MHVHKLDFYLSSCSTGLKRVSFRLKQRFKSLAEYKQESIQIEEFCFKKTFWTNLVKKDKKMKNSNFCWKYILLHHMATRFFATVQIFQCHSCADKQKNLRGLSKVRLCKNAKNFKKIFWPWIRESVDAIWYHYCIIIVLEIITCMLKTFIFFKWILFG